MIPALAALTAVTGIGGIGLTTLGLLKTPGLRGGRFQRWRDIKRKDHLATLKSRQRLLIAIAVGALMWLLTGWFLAVALVPAALLGLPALLRKSQQLDIERLEAMSEWAQNLSSVLGVGVGIEQALTTSVQTAPQPIRAEVTRLAARLHARWDTQAALRAFADDLNDATGDFLTTALMLGAHRRGTQLTSILDGLAAAIRDDVRVRRTIHAEQAKGRTVARLVTGISTFGVGLMLLSPYAEPYRTGPGQILLALLMTGFVGCLVWMRYITHTPKHARILVHSPKERGKTA